MPVTLAELARRFGGRVRGADGIKIDGVAPLDRAGPNQIAYLNDRKYEPLLATTRAGAVILRESAAGKYDGNALITEAPQLCFARVATLLHPSTVSAPGIHATATVDPRARVAETASIGPNAVVEAGAILEDDVVVGPGCHIGRDAVVGARTRLIGLVWFGERCRIGVDGVIHPGVVIGGDGFGYAKDGERWVRIPQLGRVVIGNDVDVGANSTIDRGALDDTVIGDGVKIDNLVQIAHNVRVGEHTIMAAAVGVSGSVTIGRRCVFGGMVGIAGHLQITDDVQVLGTSLVAGSITEPGTYSSALPAESVERWRRNAVRLRHLDEIVQRLRELEQEIQRLKGE